ncbi:DUF3172 domain-containing protein [Synechococcus sp. CS-1325]|uniref:DUF3172 domain-containing protein n=1 Tax=unclassified Synechococcus TaxID=2626047 RepID=UPI000DB174CB|nr:MULTISPECIES: DUF3172 domain-containing protein [unclassified Synechococcus]PZV00913.1 MAG: DUF3172 domain-containing protein [Cyanobium sp.]MCT0198121.1 DUF3172 domain-containing protein [Synechococcus sp. CS-1325]MCT0211940.1 DUF3172 domain-containing protein [Synechococcus sp. CS-1326]MCT0229687.1 DUF3172 domain-containing protein [Synechococcus sp. CS-1324]MCT0232352.1 DUF3172 domain-containing protein [Synechococcus sp. CS-1327]
MSRPPYGRSSSSQDRDQDRDGYAYRSTAYDDRPRGRREAPPRKAGAAGPGGPGGGSGDPPFKFNVATVAVLAGVLVVGIGIGTALSSNTVGNQGNIASSQQLDLAVPDPEFCKQWGASAFVNDIELYTTMNPSSSFVTQPTLQPGCVIRRENWSVLQKEGAVTAEQMRQCKQRMNTFAYIGSIRDKPVVRCVYQTDIGGNKFQTRGIAGAADDSVGITPEGDQF